MLVLGRVGLIQVLGPTVEFHATRAKKRSGKPLHPLAAAVNDYRSPCGGNAPSGLDLPAPTGEHPVTGSEVRANRC
jgi:hypothetical protein